ncbi:MAG TPA: 5-histidylcysteine sulfoxide synthase [Prolixibacteraceae bacterium]|nr:5-histidylcysteine sulfoxide synthase [Prolixibacteraceae bacterium]
MDPRFITKSINLNTGNPEQKRAEILDYFKRTYSLDEHLFEVFADTAGMYRTADPLRHPLIFYFGHTAAFYINKLVISKILETRINPRFESMFAIGVDEMSWDDLNQSNYKWPAVEEVKDYRRQVYDTVIRQIETLPIQLPIRWEDPIWIILMGIEHSRIHIETSSVLIRQLPLDFLQPVPGWNTCKSKSSAPENRLIAVNGATIKLGKSFNDPLYGWDNEYGSHQAEVAPFEASSYLCSNGEFLEFILSHGYHTERFWTEEGWSWKSYTQAEHPLFWRKKGDNYQLRLVFELIEMPWNWPVEVNYLEAKAFCNWKKEKTGVPIRLMTEEEWYILHDQAQIPDLPAWETAPGNINLEHFQSPCPVDQFSFGEFYDLIGNVWQWTETPISGYKGFKIHPSYDDFSTPTFDTRHNMIKGGSWISTGNEAIRDSRYAFRRHFYQHAGFRYVSSNQEVKINTDTYETDPEVVLYCETHYGNTPQTVPNFQKSLADFCIKISSSGNQRCALDMGCKTGRSTWELARTFNNVTGVDLSARTIRVATQLQEQGRFNYIFPEEGEIVDYMQVTLDDFDLAPLVKKVKFLQSDFANLKNVFSGYDLILLNDILDRVYQPKELLAQLHLRLNDKGILVIATSYDWDGKFTKPENWLGGFRSSAEPVRGTDTLEELLKENFNRTDLSTVLPSVFRINKRKSILKDVEVTVWKKR